MKTIFVLSALATLAAPTAFFLLPVGFIAVGFLLLAAGFYAIVAGDYSRPPHSRRMERELARLRLRKERFGLAA